MFQRRAKKKAEAAMQNFISEDQRDLNPTSGCPKADEAETREWSESPHERNDQLKDMLKTSTAPLQVSQDESESQTTDDLPEERRNTSKIDSRDTQTPTRASLVPFNTPNYRFECICGELGIIDYKARVQCMNCQLWQHADCVNYKVESLKTTPFYCPHCLVAMKPVSTGATLIISPSSICHQWVEEIHRHIRSSSLRVLV